MLRKLIIISVLILLFGLIGHYDYVSEVECSNIDKVNKQLVINSDSFRDTWNIK